VVENMTDSLIHETNRLSLLWPSDGLATEHHAGNVLDEHCIRDLDVAKIVTALSPVSRQKRDIEAIMLRLCSVPDVIRYRQDIVDDLLSRPELCTGFEALVPLLNELAYGRYREDRHTPNFHEVVWRLNELARLVEGIHSLHDLLSDHPGQLRSQGLHALSTHVEQVRQDPLFQQLEQELPELMAQIEQVQSITIGVNLNQDLLPVEATLLSVNKKTVTEASLMSKLFGSFM
jgi:hypothetical protein